MQRNRILLNAEGGTNLRFPIGRVRWEAAGGTAGADPKVRRFKLKGYTGGKVALPGFNYPVIFDLKTMWKNEGQTPLLLDHKFDQPVGHSENLRITETEVSGLGFTSVPGTWRDTVNEAAENKFVWQLSVGGLGDPADVEFVPVNRSVRINGRTLHGPAYVVRNYQLREVSFVSMGADNEGAHATLVAAFLKGFEMNFTAWLRSKGKDIEALSAAELATLRAEFDQWKQAQASGGAGAGTGGDSGTGGQSAGGAGAGGTAGGTAGGAATGGTATGGTATGGAPAGGSVGGGNGPANVGGGSPSGSATVVIGPVTGGPSAAETDYLNRIAAQNERVATLTQMNAHFTSELGAEPVFEFTENGQPRRVPMLAHAIRDPHFTPERFELLALRQARPQVPRGRNDQTGDSDRVIMQAAFVGALVERAGIALDNPFFGSALSRVHMNAAFQLPVSDQGRQRWMNAAGQFRNHSLVDMVREVCEVEQRVDLQRCGHWRNPQWMQAAFSSMAVQDLFTQSIQAVLLATYAEQTAQWLEAFVNNRDVPNYMINERPRVLLGGNDFEKLLPTGTANEITMSSTGEQYQISSFAAMIRVNDETLINERFDVIEDQPKAMGQAAGRLEPELALLVLLSNPNMKDGQPLFITGFNRRTGSPFSDVNLEAALNQMALMKENGQTINLDATHLFHAKSRRFGIARILSAAQLITGANATTSSQNVLANIVQPVFDARLDNGFTNPNNRRSTIAGEPGSWFLSDKRYPGLEMGHLMGTARSVQLNSGRMTEGQWGIWVAGKKSVGCAAMRRESMQKNEQ
jgi:hypothetical protein